MKRDRQSVNLRHAEMLAYIREHRQADVEELAAAFGVSSMTVRRDLQILSERGQISRTHGGATADVRPTASAEKDEVALCRRLIACYAATLISSGDRIFINGSRTALGLLEFVRDRTVHVFSNNGAAVEQEYPSGVDITLSGGSLRGKNHIMTGDCTLRNLLMEQADIAFLGCSGISPGGEILCGIPTELGINDTMISHASRYYILADHTKIGKTGTYASFSLEKSGCVITDERANPQVLAQLRAVGMSVVQVRRADFPEISAPAKE